MERIRLVAPTNGYGRQVMDYKDDFLINNESMDGIGGLRNFDNYNDWLNYVKDNSKEETVHEGLVPASQFLAIRISDNKLVGMIDIRHKLNEYLFNFAGNIGYSVRKSERRKGYAKEMLSLALKKCTELNLNRILITCDTENSASSKTIISNGGILENVIPEEDRFTQRYWISV